MKLKNLKRPPVRQWTTAVLGRMLDISAHPARERLTSWSQEHSS